MKKYIFLILMSCLLLTSCVATYTVNSKVNETPFSLGLGFGYIYYSRTTDLGLGISSDVSMEFFESETQKQFIHYRIGPNFEYQKVVAAIIFNVDYIRDVEVGELTSNQNYLSVELGYNLGDRCFIGADINARKEITLICRLMYVDKHL